VRDRRFVSTGEHRAADPASRDAAKAIPMAGRALPAAHPHTEFDDDSSRCRCRHEQAVDGFRLSGFLPRRIE